MVADGANPKISRRQSTSIGFTQQSSQVLNKSGREEVSSRTPKLYQAKPLQCPSRDVSRMDTNSKSQGNKQYMGHVVNF